MNIGPSASRPVLSVFDFDGTLTTRDSFTLFLKAMIGLPRYSVGLAQLARPSITFALGFDDRGRLKQSLVGTFLSGTSVAWLESAAQEFCERYWDVLMRPDELRAVQAELDSGAIVTLCSASPIQILKPFADRLGIGLIATDLEIKNQTLTGKLSGENCRCAQKIVRLQDVYGDLALYHIRAWGDSADDKQLLGKADAPHYRAFHRSKPRIC